MGVFERLNVGNFNCRTHPKTLMPLEAPKSTVQIREFTNTELLAGAGLGFIQDLSANTHTFWLW